MRSGKFLDGMNVQAIVQLSNLALEKGRAFSAKRDLFSRLKKAKGRHFTGIVGLRGVGKTVLLQQLAAQTPDAFYLSADTLPPEEDGFALIQRLADKFSYRVFFLDEIHHLPAAGGLLKKLFDFLDIRVFFTSSVALSMEASRHDLSRRVKLLTLLPFSYREYLRIVRKIELPPVSFVNYSSLSRNLGITKYKAEQYASCMEQAFVLRQVFPIGTNVLREPKILLTPPYRLLYLDPDDAMGGLREDFCVEALVQAGFTPAYLKSTRGSKIPDYMVEWDDMNIAVEIGGRGKGREQFKGIQADHKLVFAHMDANGQGRLPLYLLGMITPNADQKPSHWRIRETQGTWALGPDVRRVRCRHPPPKNAARNSRVPAAGRPCAGPGNIRTCRSCGSRSGGDTRPPDRETGI